MKSFGVLHINSNASLQYSVNLKLTECTDKQFNESIVSFYEYQVPVQGNIKFKQWEDNVDFDYLNVVSHIFNIAALISCILYRFRGQASRRKNTALYIC